MCASGISTRDIRASLQDQYGIGVSAEYVSTVTDRVLDDTKAWQNHPLDSMYPVVFFDAMRVKIHSGMVIKPMAVHIALGIAADGSREILDMWTAENEGAGFRVTVFSALKARGLEDILIAVTDGLKGMKEALEAAFPKTLLQTCIIHLIRSSLKMVSYKDYKAVTAALKPICGAVNTEQASRALDDFSGSDLGKKYPYIAKQWLDARDRVIPFFDFSPNVSGG